MTPDELEEEYFRVMCEAELARERVRALLSENNATYAMLLNGMTYGLPEAWLHPSAELLWIQCGGRIDLIKELATLIPIYKNIPMPHRTGVSIRHTAHDLLYGLSQALTPDMECVFPARIFTVAGWLMELSLTEELLCDMEEHTAVLRFLARWRYLWAKDGE